MIFGRSTSTIVRREKTDNAGAPRSERDAVCGEVETRGSEVNAEEILETRVA
jgi:hypothetical protein